jgi:hypothetical protein
MKGSLTLSPGQAQAVRKILEWVAAQTNERGIPLGIAGTAADVLPDLYTVREASLPQQRSSVPGGESTRARTKRLRREARVRDGRCAAPDFLGVHCQGPPELDHVFGKAKEPETIEVVWELCQRHHRLKTDWHPSRLLWLLRFLEHAAQHGYGEALARTERAVAQERGQHPGHEEAGHG